MDSSRRPASSGTPAREYRIDSELVAGLLADQHADLASLPLALLGEGWDNVLFGLGEHLLVRLPRRAAAAQLIRHEQLWLPSLAGQLSLPIPVPLRVGLPGRHYPWYWSIVPWLAGQTADQQQPDASQAYSFASFLRSLHVVAPATAPANPYRGVPLGQRASVVAQRMERVASQTSLITPHIRQVWQDALEAPLAQECCWLHGDLHPGNVLVEKGVITGIIDWGDLTAGDPATDLAAVYMLFEEEAARQNAFTTYGYPPDATLKRAKGWAVLFGVTLLEAGLINSPMNALVGRRTLQGLSQ